MGKKIRVIVVDDSGLMRLIISDIIRSTEDMELIGTAEDGKSAVELVSKALPGVVLMDINMSPHDGLYGVEEILKRHKVPIILLSSVGNSDLDRVFQALKLGAVDYINKPKKNKNKLREIGDEIIERVRSIAHSSNLQLSEQRSNTNQHAHTFDENLAYQVVVIGASTGGPTAIEKVIRNLPSNLPVPVLIAQHMHANFITTFSSRLNRCTPLMVKIGRAGETLRPGVIYVMPGNTNSIVERRADNNVYLVESNQQYKEYNHPSINALMHSCLLYTSPSPRDGATSRMPSSA